MQMNRIEAFTAIMSGQKVQPDNWKSPGWYLELGGVGPNAGDPPDQVMMVINPTDKRAYTHWPDVNYSIYEVKVSLTGTQVGNAAVSEAKKAGLSDSQASSLASGIKSILGF